MTNAQFETIDLGTLDTVHGGVGGKGKIIAKAAKKAAPYVKAGWEKVKQGASYVGRLAKDYLMIEGAEKVASDVTEKHP